MNKENEIFYELKKLREKLEILANPLYNDAGGSILWGEVYIKVDEAYKILFKDKRIYGW